MNDLTLWAAFCEIVDEYPGMSAKQAKERAVMRVLGTEPPEPPPFPYSLLKNPVAFGEWLYVNCPEAVQHVKDQKLINAIKAARMMTGAGLKESKEAVEAMRYNQMGIGPVPHFLKYF